METIVGDDEIDLEDEIAAALKSMTDEELSLDAEESFDVVVERVCAQTGYQRIFAKRCCDVYPILADERHRRREKANELTRLFYAAIADPTDVEER